MNNIKKWQTALPTKVFGPFPQKFMGFFLKNSACLFSVGAADAEWQPAHFYMYAYAVRS